MNSSSKNPGKAQAAQSSWAEARPHLEILLDASQQKRQEYFERVLGDQPRVRRAVEDFLSAEAKDPELLETGAAARVPQLLADISAASEAAALETTATAGQQIHQWTVRGVLGRGGMATVYEVDRQGDGYTLKAALKLLHLGLDTPSLRARFRTERAALARLRHPGIAHLIDGGMAEDGRPFVVMELVEGHSLLHHCRDHEVDLQGRLRLLREVCEAVAYAHRRLVIHRDLKPSNVMVTAEGQIKLLDFGIAKVLAPDEDSPPTLLHTPMTPAYASPEQRLGGEVTTASDVYSLGVLMWELLVGTRPPRPDPGVTVGPGAPSRATANSSLQQQLRGDLDAVVQHCLEPQPEDRYLSPADLARDLDRYLEGEPISIRRVPRRERLKRWIARNRLAAAAIAIASTSLIGGTVSSSVSSHQAELQRNLAVQEAAKSRSAMVFVEGLLQASASDQMQGETLTVRQLLTDAEQRLASDLEGQFELQQEVFALLTDLYLSLSLNSEAVATSQQALELAKATGGSRLEIALLQQRLGFVWVKAGKPLLAVPALDESLATLEQELGELAPEVLTALRFRTYADVGKTLAEVHEQRSLVVERERRVASGRDTVSLAQSLNDRSRTLFYLGWTEEAQAEIQEALAMRRRLGTSTGSLRVSLNNLALIQLGRGDFHGAEHSAREGISLGVAERGRGQMATVTPLLRLAESLRRQGLLDEALKAAQEAFEIQGAFIPGQHQLAQSLRILALIECDQGAFESAHEHLREAVHYLAAEFPADGWRVGEFHATSGRCLALEGRTQEALQLLLGSRQNVAAELTDQSPVVREIDQLLEQLAAD